MSEQEPLQAVEDWAGVLLAQLSPAARRQLARKMAIQIRRTQRQRIAAQQNPDGRRFAPRRPRLRDKAKRGRVRAAMFAKLRGAQYLRYWLTPEGVEIGFTQQVMRVAQVHQYGLREKMLGSGVSVQYPQRELLGVTDAERDLIRDLLVEHLT